MDALYGLLVLFLTGAIARAGVIGFQALKRRWFGAQS